MIDSTSASEVGGSRSLDQSIAIGKPQAPTNLVTAKSFPAWKKVCSIFVLLTLIVPLVAFLHKMITGSPSRIWLFLIWEVASPGPQRNIESLSPETTTTIAPIAAQGDASQSDPMPVVHQEGTVDDVAESVVNAPSPLSVPQQQLYDELVARINESAPGDEIEAKLIAHVRWMIDEGYQHEFIIRTIDFSLEMEGRHIFSCLTKTILPDRYFLVPNARDRIDLRLRQHRSGDKLGLFCKSSAESLETCERNYKALMSGKELDKIAEVMMSQYGLDGLIGKADSDVLNSAVAAFVYRPGENFRTEKIPTPDEVLCQIKHVRERMLMGRGQRQTEYPEVTHAQVLDWLALMYAFSQGLMRHMPIFPGREGDVVHTYRRIWIEPDAQGNVSVPSHFTGEYIQLFSQIEQHKNAARHDIGVVDRLDDWDYVCNQLHTKFPNLVAADGTLIDESGEPKKFMIPLSGQYPLQSHSVAATGQRRVTEGIEDLSFGNVAYECELSIYSIFDPALFREKGVPMEREVIALARPSMAKVSLYKSSERYRAKAKSELEKQYPNISFKTEQS
ncbi:MAG: hypothetical protein LBI34_04210 [Puniceicoccales bacterium]|jgi:hypothetical protein|nr:hypothetical protein [Puniceicoccales bacterium]